MISKKEKSGSRHKKAVVLLSGGMDSAVCASLAAEQGYEIYALTVDYGQRNRFEMEAASDLAVSMGASHLVVKTELDKIGGSALTDRSIDIPPESEGVLPVTYVPARNLILLSIGVAWAEVLGAGSVFIGANVRDYSGYPDCRGDFLRSFEKTAFLGTKREIRISVKAPLLMMTKADIAAEGERLGIDFSRTTSCYDPSPEGEECGICSSCLLRERGFKGVSSGAEKELQ